MRLIPTAAFLALPLLVAAACGGSNAGNQPAAPAPPAPGPGPAPAPAGASLSTPGPLALPCQSDAACGLHHCNTQYGKCVFPCQTPTDCVSNNCMMGVCLPGSGS